MRKLFFWKLKRRVLNLGDRTLLMAILNVTPDSFSDGGRYLHPSEAVEHGRLMAQQGAKIIDIEALVPPELEEIVGLPQGHIFHGELTADQLFWQRPAPHWADYRTPVAGLYQCGSSTHPGGGVSGVPGHNAAREILKDWKRLRRA